MESNLALDDLGHQSRRRAAHRRDQLKDVLAFSLFVESPLDCLDLSAEPADTLQKLHFVPDKVGHAHTIPG
jgi:hypothetical protein